MLKLRAMAGNFRFQCLIELGEIAAADRELAGLHTLTAQLRRPYFRYVALLRAFARPPAGRRSRPGRAAGCRRV